MPRKKENPVGAPLPGFDIFGQDLPPSDSGVLLKTPYRRKQLAGFVPLWNEFFRCYHHAGVSPNAVYLWAYLRQYEHERREWNAVSDISWPGRRDIAEVLGVSLSHLPNLLEELRRAGLVTFQLVLPGFEELAAELNTDVEQVRDRAADYGVNPKVDATLYRTADPYTKTEFAAHTNLKFCKPCKAYRYCEGALAQRENQSKLEVKPRKMSQLSSVETPRELNAPLAVTLNRTSINTVASSVADNRVLVESATESKKKRSANRVRISDRINSESATESKKEQSPILTSNQTSINKPCSNNQPEISTNQTVVVQPDLALLLKFGFDSKTAQHLLNSATRHNKPDGYVATILQYARENASRNPLGLVRRLIESGEDRQTRASRWQQPNLFSLATTAESENAAEAVIEPAFAPELNPSETCPPPDNEPRSVSFSAAPSTASEPAANSDAVWWADLLQNLAQQNSPLAGLLAYSAAQRDGANLTVIMRNVVECHRANSYADVFQRVIADTCGNWYNVKFSTNT